MHRTADLLGMLILILVRALLLSQSAVALENIALRQQVAVLKRRVKRPRLRRRDRLFWVLARRLWSGWRDSLLTVRPRQLLEEYAIYYTAGRSHQALDGDAPEPRASASPAVGDIVGCPVLGGLHHVYERAA